MTQTIQFDEPGAVVLSEGKTVSAHTDLSSHRGIGYLITGKEGDYRSTIKGYGQLMPSFATKLGAERYAIKRIDSMIAASPSSFGRGVVAKTK